MASRAIGPKQRPQAKPCAPPQLAQYYRERLGAQGYAERAEHPGQGLLVFTRSTTTVSIALQALDEGGGSAVFVNQVEGSP